MRIKLYIVLYTFLSIGMWFYSFTQIDLNLTISGNSLWKTIQEFFQHVGYFQRPLSAGIYSVLIIGFFFVYYVILRDILQGRLALRQLIIIICLITGILISAYPAFSYDIYNYVFTAKTVAVYHLNPYAIKPIELAGVDPWTTFMRWTHLPSAYSPVWIAISLPVFYLGFGYFLPTLIAFKMLFAICYLLTVLYIWKAMQIADKEHALLGTAVFALNPLVIIESIVSPHNDIVMAMFVVIAYYLFLTNKRMVSFLFLAISAATKSMTVFLYPAAVLGWNRKALLCCISVAACVAFYKREILPWYLLWVLPFVALNNSMWRVVLVFGSISAGLMFRYIPYIFYGEYTVLVNNLRFVLMIIPVIFGCIFTLFASRSHRTV